MQEAAKAVRRPGIAGTFAATLLLSVCCAPLLAATGVDCDQAAALPDSIDISKPDLSVTTVAEHTVTSPMSEPRDGEQLRRPSASTVSLAPRAETILRRIFDESYSSTDLDQLAPASATGAKSIAELTAPAEATESSNEEKDAELPALDADLPGMSEDETLRYRRQMFRTDI